MKRIFLIAFFVAILSNLKAQEYINFPASNANLSISLVMLLVAIFITTSNRAISNYILRKYYTDTKQGHPAHFLPYWIMIYNMAGFTLLLSSIIFAFTIKWWLGFLFILAWFLMYFYKPELASLRIIYNNGNAKRCVVCKKFYGYDSFKTIKSNIDGLDSKCKACYS